MNEVALLRVKEIVWFFIVMQTSLFPNARYIVFVCRLRWWFSPEMNNTCIISSYTIAGITICQRIWTSRDRASMIRKFLNQWPSVATWWALGLSAEKHSSTRKTWAHPFSNIRSRSTFSSKCITITLNRVQVLNIFLTRTTNIIDLYSRYIRDNQLVQAWNELIISE